jgi:nitronate monooxygenase
MSTASDLGLAIPLIAAPMAGGPSTPALVLATARCGGLGFLAGGYQTPQALASQLAEVRSQTAVFGVNLFAPNPITVDGGEFRRYAAAIRADADGYGLTLASSPTEDDDSWDEKISLLLADPVPVVSCTFGIPPRRIVQALRKAGTLVVQTVTSAEEARAATESGVDMLAVQASAAGGHSGTFTPAHVPAETPLLDLLAQVRSQTALPVLAAGGLASPADLAAVLRAGATAAIVGTVLLLADESGASDPYRRALADPARRGTVVTRAFTGRPARALRNEFIDRHDAAAPLGYPAVHHLTSPLRKAATAAGDAERVNLWAGVGYRSATPEPVARIVDRLTERL